MMKIETKLGLLRSVIIVVAVIGFFVLRGAERDRGELFFKERKEAKNVLLDRMLKFEGTSLRTFALDYATRGGIVDFVTGKKGRKRAEQSISRGLSVYHADAAWRRKTIDGGGRNE